MPSSVLAGRQLVSFAEACTRLGMQSLKLSGALAQEAAARVSAAGGSGARTLDAGDSGIGADAEPVWGHEAGGESGAKALSHSVSYNLAALCHRWLAPWAGPWLLDG